MIDMDQIPQRLLVRQSEIEIPVLLSYIEGFDDNRRAANFAVALLENRAVPEEQDGDVRETLRAFIEGTAGSKAENDNIAMRSAIRKFVFFQEPGDYEQIEWLLRLFEEDEDNYLETVITLMAFVRFLGPKRGRPTSGLAEILRENCRRHSTAEAMNNVHLRVIVMDSLMSLTMFGDEQAQSLADALREISPGLAKSVARRLSEIKE